MFAAGVLARFDHGRDSGVVLRDWARQDRYFSSRCVRYISSVASSGGTTPAIGGSE